MIEDTITARIAGPASEIGAAAWTACDAFLRESASRACLYSVSERIQRSRRMAA